MRVLVTGAAGGVGRAVAAELETAGHEVVGLARSGGDRPRAGTWAAADLGDPDLDLASVIERRCDAIVHAAAEIPPADERRIILGNCLGTQRVVELRQAWEARSLVYISSIPVLGRPGPRPLDEDDPVAPSNLYLTTKAFGEQLVAAERERAGGAVALRLSSPIGAQPRHSRLVSTFIARALSGEPLEVAGDGVRQQDYVDVRDVATAVRAAIEGRPSSGLYHIGSGRSTSNIELARQCVAALGSESEILTGRRPDPEADVRWSVSIERARAELGYEPRQTLEASIRSSAEHLSREP